MQGITDIEIKGLTSDSRRVEPGFLFAALPGAEFDGRAFIPQAIERGAAAVLVPPGDHPLSQDLSFPLIVDDNPRRRFALMAAKFFSQQPERVAAVTGTNGKTSVVIFLHQIWTQLGCKAASLGTLGVCSPGMQTPNGKTHANLTTPDPVDLHRTLHDLAAAGVDRLALEASSHGLSQYRLDGVEVMAAAFTNLTRDHLDYHGLMDVYLGAKLRLFTDILSDGGTAVINADVPYGDAVEAACRGRGLRVMSYGEQGRDIRLNGCIVQAECQILDLSVNGRDYTVRLPLIGGFQVSNALCALGLALACGEDRDAAVGALDKLHGVPGRVHKAGQRANGAPVYVDYAHTPDALAGILTAMRPHVQGKLYVVFGCGGDRDSGKRPEMGDISCRLADGVIVTDDNPRTEDAAEIRREILAACPGAQEIGDRREAIFSAVAALGSGDLLVVAGKGHEQGQIAGDRVIPFDDAKVIAEAIEEVEQ